MKKNDGMIYVYDYVHKRMLPVTALEVRVMDIRWIMYTDDIPYTHVDFFFDTIFDLLLAGV